MVARKDTYRLSIKSCELHLHAEMFTSVLTKYSYWFIANCSILYCFHLLYITVHSQYFLKLFSHTCRYIVKILYSSKLAFECMWNGAIVFQIIITHSFCKNWFICNKFIIRENTMCDAWMPSLELFKVLKGNSFISERHCVLASENVRRAYLQTKYYWGWAEVIQNCQTPFWKLHTLKFLYLFLCLWKRMKCEGRASV